MGLVDGSVASGTDPVASACFRLGWRMEELFSQFAVPDRPPRAYDLAHLCGLSKLTSYDWQRLGLDQVDFVVGQVTAKVGAAGRRPAGSDHRCAPQARGHNRAARRGGVRPRGIPGSPQHAAREPARYPYGS